MQESDKILEVDEGVDFEFPTNIRQIGTIPKGMAIYIEDYAYTYLYQYAESGGYDEKIAALAGRVIKKGSDTILLIVGAIKGKYSRELNGTLSFTEEDWEYIDKQMETYFKAYKIVGWMHSQPGYGAFLNTTDANMHMELFPEKHHVLYLIDPKEKVDAFFNRTDNMDGMDELRGYFVYYEKNLAMQNYMLENKIIDLKLSDQEIEGLTEKKDVVSEYRRHDRLKKEKELVARKSGNMFATLSAVLFLICLVMGAGLIQNNGRITRLESDIKGISELYGALTARINGSSASEAFAGQADYNDTESDLTDASIIDPSLNEKHALDNPAETPATGSQEQQPAATETSVKTIPEYYIVESGDSLSYISVFFYGTNRYQQQIMELNNIDDPNHIFVGKKLKLPQK